MRDRRDGRSISFPLLVAGLQPPHAGVALAQDHAKVDPKHCKVEFEDGNVRVLRWNVGPHEKIPMHEHPAFVSIALTGGHSIYTLPDGKTKEDHLKPGQVTWSAGDKHANESLSEKPAETIQVELKTKPATRTPAAEKVDPDDSTKLDPKHYKVELENDYARVIRVRYGPGEKSVMHHHPRLIAINLSGGNFCLHPAGWNDAGESEQARRRERHACREPSAAEPWRLPIGGHPSGAEVGSNSTSR